MTSLLAALEEAIDVLEASAHRLIPLSPVHGRRLQNLAQLKRLRAVLADGQEVLNRRVGRPDTPKSPAATALMDLHFALARLLVSYGVLFIDDAKVEHTVLLVAALRLLDTGTRGAAGMPLDLPELPAR